MKKDKIAFCFDFDETLVRCDRNYNIETFYTKVKIKIKFSVMNKFFKSLIDMKEDVFIITSRPKKALKEIQKYYKLKDSRIICRSYANDLKSLKLIKSNKKARDQMIRKTTSDKINVLNEIASKYRLAWFFDDMADNFKNRSDMRANILIRKPPHLD